MKTLPTAGGKARGPLSQVEVPVQLSKTCQPNAELVMARSYVGEAPPINHGLNGRHGRVDTRLKFCIDQSADRLPLSHRANSDEWALPLMRLDQDQLAVGPQIVPRSVEGMDHALCRDSSKGPAEESNVERATADAHSFCRANTERDIADAFRSGCAPGKRNPRWVRLDGYHARSKGRELTGQPAIAASQLEDASARQPDQALDETHLHPGCG
jgi:hypothetical protein